MTVAHQHPLPADAGALPAGARASSDKAIDAKDFQVLAALPLLGAVAWLLPDAAILSLSRALSRLLHRLHPQRYGELAEIFRDFPQPPLDPATQREILIETASLHRLERLQLLRYHRPGSWRPKLELTGEDHLRRALAQGKGAILWVAFTTFSDMFAKVALREQGYAVWHLSRYNHGHFSSTRFGQQFLNPIRIAIECRYLAERVVIDPAAPKAAIGRLADMLAQNRIVSITVGADAKRVTMMPYGPGYLPLAGGAAKLALDSGAPLIPVFTERLADGRVGVILEPPIAVPADGSQADKIAAMLSQQCALMYRYFQREPAQYHFLALHRARKELDSGVQAAEESAFGVQQAAEGPRGEPLAAIGQEAAFAASASQEAAAALEQDPLR